MICYRQEERNELVITDSTDDSISNVLDSMDKRVLDDTVLEWRQVVDKQNDIV